MSCKEFITQLKTLTIMVTHCHSYTTQTALAIYIVVVLYSTNCMYSQSTSGVVQISNQLEVFVLVL